MERKKMKKLEIELLTTGIVWDDTFGLALRIAFFR